MKANINKLTFIKMYILKNPKRMSLSLSKKLPFAVLKTPTSFPPHTSKSFPLHILYIPLRDEFSFFMENFARSLNLNLNEKNLIQYKINQGKSFFFGLFLEVKVNEFPIKLFPNIPTIYIVGNESKS